MIVRTANRLPGNQDNVPSWLKTILLQAHNLTQAALDAIALHSIPNATVDRKAKASVGQVVRQDAQDEQMIYKGAPLLADLLKTFVRADPVSPLHTLSRCLNCRLAPRCTEADVT